MQVAQYKNTAKPQLAINVTGVTVLPTQGLQKVELGNKALTFDRIKSSRYP